MCEEISMEDLLDAKNRALESLTLTWEELEAKNSAGDCTTRERMTYLAFKDI